MALNTPKRIKTIKTYTSSPGNEYGTWYGDGQQQLTTTGNHSLFQTPNNGSDSPVSSCDSPEFSGRRNASGTSAYSSSDGRENRRGRPRSEALPTLMDEGSTSPSAIRCSFCNRVFPREKSLQAHLRTHTGERPYSCDYPGCTRAFTQSGQLKTHMRLHTGERPFMCSAKDCVMRFTHANRHCPDHPYDQLKRVDDFVIQASTEQNHEVIKWLEKYKMEKEDRTPTRKTPKRPKCDTMNLGNSMEKNENIIINGDEENHHPQFPVTPSNPYKSRKGLMMELDMNAGLGTSPLAGGKMKPIPKVIHWQDSLSQEEDSADECEIRSTFNPKKRWLREACQDDLAKPLDAFPNHSSSLIYPSHTNPYRNYTQPAIPLASHPATTNATNQQLNPNQMRPTVLMVASKDKATPLVNINNSNNDSGLLNDSRPEDAINQPYLNTSNYSSDYNINNANVDAQLTHDQCNMYSSISSEWPHSMPSSPTNSTFSSKPYNDNSALLLTSIESDSNYCNNTTNTTTNTSITSNESPSNHDANSKNRKWIGALALIQLATDENNCTISSSTSFNSSASSSSSSSSSSLSLSSAAASSASSAVTSPSPASSTAPLVI